MSGRKKQEQRLIRNRDLLSVFLRSFFIQTVWNFKSLLAVGLSFALIPVAKRVCKNEQELKEFLNRHLAFFNAHPYFSAYAIGAIARLEEAHALGELDDVEKINKFKNAIIGPLGAVGDQFFWATIKPASLLLGLLGVAVFQDMRWKVASLVVLLLAYNIPHLYIRLAGLWQGYRKGFDIYKTLRMEHFQRVRTIYALVGAAALGLFTGFVFTREWSDSALSGLVFMTTGVFTVALRKKTSSFYLPVAAAILVSLILGLL